MRFHLVAEVTKKIVLTAWIQALGQVERRHATRCSGVEVALCAWLGQGIGQMNQVARPITNERFVEQRDTFIEHGRRPVGLPQLQQAMAGVGGNLRWPDPVQPRWIVIPLEALDVSASLRDRRGAASGVTQGREGVGLWMPDECGAPALSRHAWSGPGRARASVNRIRKFDRSRV